MNSTVLSTYKSEVTNELSAILKWWMTYTVDHENGGFYGKVDDDNLAAPTAPKGLVLNSRILYTFSSAYLLNRKEEYLAIANRAFDYLTAYFLDEENGGFYWSVDFNGHRLDDKKQVYGQAFIIYALAEYIKITPNERALVLAKNTFELLEQHSFDPINTGYVEALTKDWKAIEDFRLSDKDQNEKKSMNTHLHVIEAYANLYSVWKNEKLKLAIKSLLSNFKYHIIDKEHYHLQLFFTETWDVKSTLVSFGHDIEASWLLQEAATLIADEMEIKAFKHIALQLSNAALKGLDKSDGLLHEFDYKTAQWSKEMHWWPQAEAMVGFLNAWQINGDQKFLLQSFKSWSFIKNYLKSKNGEWHWGIYSDYTLMQGEDKAGFWKCPYHNGRACIEIIKRLK
ncbi:N-acyl-D-glucosamine 2-epimerase [Pedobacter hiemivivus]|uniref:Cellobiose 2-epimerase n=1 Tax=Pedobacter hiemivivus TaxID=2530454 RepID=A0A4U1G0Y2_9SPHI|nr:AGE family epimerase/isomerase [Pedobacter hiemivivus]TKC55953.1 N-acyl-D-glucosamine 2-epimerase [Pedobacter hiemivivus]